MFTVFLLLQVLVRKIQYGTTISYWVLYFYFHFPPYPRKLNDNEKLWIYRKLPTTVKPPIKDTSNEDKPPNKGQAESTHSIKNHL